MKKKKNNKKIGVTAEEGADNLRKALKEASKPSKYKIVTGLKSKGGRPKTTVKERLAKIKFDLKVIEELAMLGMTDKQLADVLKVDVRTVDNWKKDAQFVSVLKKGKLIADNEIIKSLYKSGIGYEYEEVKQEGVKDEDGKIVTKTITKTKKHQAPVPASMIFWLKNRQGWVDKQDFGGFDDLTITVKLVD